MTTTTAPRIARRATEAAARNAFELGMAVIVTVNGERTLTVTPDTTTHHRDWTTFDELAATVASYGDPRQQYLIVDPVASDGSPWPIAYTSNNRRVVPGLRVRDYNYRETTVTDRKPSIDGGGASGRPEVAWFHTDNGGFFDGSRLFAL